MKLKLFGILLSLALLFTLTGCEGLEDDGPDIDLNAPVDNEPGVFEMGNLVLNDGRTVTITESTDGADLAKYKDKIIGVVFKTDTRKFIIGAAKANLAWAAETSEVCTTSASGLSNVETSILVLRAEDSPKVTVQIDTAKTPYAITGDETGSDNLDIWQTNLYVSDMTDAESLKTNYPAVDWAYNYGADAAHNTAGTDYEDGWYMPSVPELIAIYTAGQANEGRNILYSALARVSDLIGFEEDILLSQDTYWSASWGNISTGSGEILAPLTVYKGQDISNNTLDGTAKPADVIALFPLD